MVLIREKSGNIVSREGGRTVQISNQDAARKEFEAAKVEKRDASESNIRSSGGSSKSEVFKGSNIPKPIITSINKKDVELTSREKQIVSNVERRTNIRRIEQSESLRSTGVNKPEPVLEPKSNVIKRNELAEGLPAGLFLPDSDPRSFEERLRGDNKPFTPKPFTAGRGGEVRALTEEESKVFNEVKASESGLKKIKKDFSAGARVGLLFEQQQGDTRRAQDLSLAEVAGFAGGLATLQAIGAAAEGIAPILSGGVRSLGATRVGAKVVSLAKTPLGRTGINIGRSIFEGEAIVKTAKNIGKRTLSSAERDLVESQDFRKVVAAGFSAESESLSKQSIAKSIGFGLSPLIAGDKNAFNKAVEDNLRSQGFNELDISRGLKAAQTQRTAGSIGEIAALLETSRLAEATGRRNVAAAFKRFEGQSLKNFGKRFGVIATQIGLAGIVEGAGQEAAAQQNREAQRNPLKIAEMGAIGGGVAAILGGSIGALRPTKPVASKTIEILTNIADPFEKPADLLQDAFEGIGKRAGFKFAEAGIVTVPTPTDVLTAAFSSGGKSSSKKASKAILPNPVPPKSPVKIPELNPVLTPINTPVNVPTPILESPFSITPVPQPKTPTPVDPFVPIPVPPEVPVDIPPQIPPQVPVNVPISIPPLVPVNVPVNIPANLRVPPLLPLELPFGSGGAGRGGVKKRVFLNELQIGGKLLGDLFAGTGNANKALGLAKRNPVSKKKRKKKVKDRKPVDRFNNILENLLGDFV